MYTLARNTPIPHGAFLFLCFVFAFFLLLFFPFCDMRRTFWEKKKICMRRQTFEKSYIEDLRTRRVRKEEYQFAFFMVAGVGNNGLYMFSSYSFIWWSISGHSLGDGWWLREGGVVFEGKRKGVVVDGAAADSMRCWTRLTKEGGAWVCLCHDTHAMKEHDESWLFLRDVLRGRVETFTNQLSIIPHSFYHLHQTAQFITPHSFYHLYQTAHPAQSSPIQSNPI
jgi:hypothetical protein